jgi:hypothetical protein
MLMQEPAYRWEGHALGWARSTRGSIFQGSSPGATAGPIIVRPGNRWRHRPTSGSKLLV